MSTRLGHGQRGVEDKRSEEQYGGVRARGIQEGGIMEKKGMSGGRMFLICLVAIACTLYLWWPAFAFRVELSWYQVPGLSSGGIAVPSLRSMGSSVGGVQSRESSTFPRVVTLPEVKEDDVAGDETELDEVARDETKAGDPVGDEVVGGEAKAVEVAEDGTNAGEVARDDSKGIAEAEKDEVESDEVAGDEARADEVAGDEKNTDAVARGETKAVKVEGDEVAGVETKADELLGKETSAGEVEGEEREESDTVAKYLCDEREHILHSRKFNPNQNPERYLAIADVPEQLSKGRHHLAELVKWARDMKRTLILPRVGCNQIGVKWELPLCAYFDVERLSEGVDWITEKHFFEINKGRNLSMLAVVLLDNARDCMNPPPRFGEKAYDRARELSKSSSQYSEESGIEHPFAKVVRDTDAGLCLQLDHLFRKPEKMEKTVKLALEERGADQFDVLVFSKVAITSFVRKSTLKPYLSALRYAPKLVQAVDKMMGERVGAESASVHWRMEKFLQQKFCTPSALRICARGLVTTLKAMRKEWNLTGIFVASDISGNGDMKSVTLSRSVGKENIPAAVEQFRWMVGKIKGVMWEDVDPILPTIDAGIQGILDKVTLARAKLFIRPPDGCGGGLSSYTREVGELRVLWGNAVVDKRWQINHSALL